MYRVSEGIRSTHGQDGAIILDVQQGQMFNLNRNRVGSRILELLESGSAESDIVTVISREFSVSCIEISRLMRSSSSSGSRAIRYAPFQ